MEPWIVAGAIIEGSMIKASDAAPRRRNIYDRPT